MPEATTETALAVQRETTGELAVTQQEAMAAKEIEGALILARRFPRNEDDARARVLESCKRPAFAAIVGYRFNRGGSPITGPSVYLAREGARIWGNLRYGFDIIEDDEETRTIRAWAWDMETNTRRQQDGTFKKLIYRKKNGWQRPDERDLRELTNKHGETAVRNCLVHLLPPDLIDDAMATALETLRDTAAKDPAEARKKLVLAFRGIGVIAEELEGYLGHKLAVITPEEIADLRGVWKSIADGNSRWSEYITNGEAKSADGAVTMDDLTKPQALPSEPPTSASEAPEPPFNPATAELLERLIARVRRLRTRVSIEKLSDEAYGLLEKASYQLFTKVAAERLELLDKAPKDTEEEDRQLFPTTATATEQGE